MTDDLDPRDALELADQVAPLFAGKGPAVQGAALACLLSLWLAGHPKEIREDLIRMHLERVRELVPLDAKALGTDA